MWLLHYVATGDIGGSMRSRSMVGWVLGELRAWASRRGESRVFFRGPGKADMKERKWMVPVEERYNPPQPEIGL